MRQRHVGIFERDESGSDLLEYQLPLDAASTTLGKRHKQVAIVVVEVSGISFASSQSSTATKAMLFVALLRLLATHVGVCLLFVERRTMI